MREVTQMNATRAYPILAVLLGLLVGAPRSRAAATDKPGDLSNECVGSEAKKNLKECPGGPSKFVIKKKRGAAFKSAPPPREKKSDSETKPHNPTQEMAAGQRDTRKTRLKARARALLITRDSRPGAPVQAHAEEVSGPSAAHPASGGRLRGARERSAARQDRSRHQGSGLEEEESARRDQGAPGRLTGQEDRGGGA